MIEGHPVLSHFKSNDVFSFYEAHKGTKPSEALMPQRHSKNGLLVLFDLALDEINIFPSG